MPEKEQIFRAIEDVATETHPTMEYLMLAYKQAAGRKFWKTADKIGEAINRLREDERDRMVSSITSLLSENSDA